MDFKQIEEETAKFAKDLEEAVGKQKGQKPTTGAKKTDIENQPLVKAKKSGKKIPIKIPPKEAKGNGEQTPSEFAAHFLKSHNAALVVTMVEKQYHLGEVKAKEIVLQALGDMPNVLSNKNTSSKEMKKAFAEAAAKCALGEEEVEGSKVTVEEPEIMELDKKQKIKVGDHVQVVVEHPTSGWGAVDKKDVGKVTYVDDVGGACKVDFPEHTGWYGNVDDLAVTDKEVGHYKPEKEPNPLNVLLTYEDTEETAGEEETLYDHSEQKYIIELEQVVNIFNQSQDILDDEPDTITLQWSDEKGEYEALIGKPETAATQPETLKPDGEYLSPQMVDALISPYQEQVNYLQHLVDKFVDTVGKVAPSLMKKLQEKTASETLPKVTTHHLNIPGNLYGVKYFTIGKSPKHYKAPKGVLMAFHQSWSGDAEAKLIAFAKKFPEQAKEVMCYYEDGIAAALVQ